MRFFAIELPPVLEAPFVACRSYLRFAAGLSALINILYIAPTIYMMQVYDRVVATGGVLTLVWLTLVVALALMTLAALDAMRARILQRAGLRLERAVAPTILNRIFMPAGNDGDGLVNAQALRLFDSVRQAVSGPAAIAVFDLPWAPIYILIAALLHPYLGLLITLSAVLLLWLTFANERATSAGTKQALRTMAASYASQERLARLGEVVRALGMRRALVGMQLTDREIGLEQTRREQFTAGIYSGVIKFLRLFLQSLALGFGAWLAVDHQISAGSVIAASVLMSRTLQPVEQLVAAWKQLQEARQAIETLGEMFIGAPERVIAFTMPAPDGALQCEQVSVAQGGRIALAGVSFALAPGEYLGVIGPSGAGKTTLIRALAGALTVERGVVRIDGADVTTWDLEKLAPHIGYLPQDCALVPGTIADNISRFARLNGVGDTSDAVLRAARSAGAHAMIVGLPEAYETRIGWNGEGLSAGQRQRIALARALYGQPRILLFDEPNASLDSDGEMALAAALAEYKAAGATIVVAAHRRAILETADKLLLLAGGRVQAFGATGDVLRQLNPAPRMVRTEVQGA